MKCSCGGQLMKSGKYEYIKAEHIIGSDNIKKQYGSFIDDGKILCEDCDDKQTVENTMEYNAITKIKNFIAWNKKEEKIQLLLETLVKDLFKKEIDVSTYYLYVDNLLEDNDFINEQNSSLYEDLADYLCDFQTWYQTYFDFSMFYQTIYYFYFEESIEQLRLGNEDSMEQMEIFSDSIFDTVYALGLDTSISKELVECIKDLKKEVLEFIKKTIDKLEQV